MNTKTQQQIYAYHILTFWALVLAIGASLFFYAYYVNAAVFGVAERTKIESEISELKSEISEIEVAYIQESKSISESILSNYNLVYTSQDNLSFVTADRSTRLTLRN